MKSIHDLFQDGVRAVIAVRTTAPYRAFLDGVTRGDRVTLYVAGVYTRASEQFVGATVKEAFGPRLVVVMDGEGSGRVLRARRGDGMHFASSAASTFSARVLPATFAVPEGTGVSGAAVAV